MSVMASQITSLTIAYSTVYSGTNQRKHQSSASLAFVQGIHRWPVNSLHKGPVTRKTFPLDDVIVEGRLSDRLWTHEIHPWYIIPDETRVPFVSYSEKSDCKISGARCIGKILPNWGDGHCDLLLFHNWLMLLINKQIFEYHLVIEFIHVSNLCFDSSRCILTLIPAWIHIITWLCGFGREITLIFFIAAGLVRLHMPGVK